MKILMICLGNICRSPLAEGILRKKILEKGLNVEVDSAGFEHGNIGSRPDKRSVIVAEKYNVDITGIRARVFEYSDFHKFDKIYVMDDYNYRNVLNMAKTQDDKGKVDYILNTAYPNKNYCVEDPYYGGQHGFETVYHQLNEACDAICNTIQNSNIYV